MLNPLGTMIILSIVFSRLFNMRGVYPAYIITNLIAWNFFSQSTQFAINSTLWGSDLLKKIYMPRTAFVVATIGTSTVNLLFSLVPLVLIYLITGIKFQLSIFLLPFSIIILGCFALGLSLLFSTVVVFFPDIAEFYPVLLTAWMYITPIIYPEKILLDFANGWILKLNPLYHILKIFRMILYDGIFPSNFDWTIAIIISSIFLVTGWFVFTNKSKSFGYHV